MKSPTFLSRPVPPTLSSDIPFGVTGYIPMIGRGGSVLLHGASVRCPEGGGFTRHIVSEGRRSICKPESQLNTSTTVYLPRTSSGARSLPDEPEGKLSESLPERPC